MHARDILSHPVVKLWPDTTLEQAVSLLTEYGFDAMPVVDQIGHVLGIMSQSDALAAAEKPRTTPVSAVMTTPAEVVHPGTDLAEIAARMLSLHLRSMPVVEAGVLVGIVARRDLLRALARTDLPVEVEIRALLDDYAGSRRQWTIEVADRCATISGSFADTAEKRVVVGLALSVDGIDRAEAVDDGATPSNREAMHSRSGPARGPDYSPRR